MNNSDEEVTKPEKPKEEELIECPYHPGEFYPYWSYCEKCYIEEKE